MTKPEDLDQGLLSQVMEAAEGLIASQNIENEKNKRAQEMMAADMLETINKEQEARENGEPVETSKEEAQKEFNAVRYIAEMNGGKFDPSGPGGSNEPPSPYSTRANRQQRYREINGF